MFVALCGGAGLACAQNATWQTVPTVAGPIAATFDFNANANWTPATVPTATAVFGATTGPNLSFSATSTTIGAFQFNAGAPSYTFNLVEIPPSCIPSCVPQALTFTGTGIVNNSSNAPTFTVFLGGTLAFQNSATAANSNIVMRLGSLDFRNTSTAGSAVVTMPDSFHPGFIRFHDISSAVNASFTLTHTTGAQIPAELIFLDASTAANATIVNNPGAISGGATTEFGILSGTDTSNAGTARITNNDSGQTSFFAMTSAANATIVNNSGGSTDIRDNATAGNAIITNNAGGSLFFGEQATAGNAKITNHAGGFVEFGFSGFFPLFIDTATAGNATIVNDGTVTFNSATTAGNAKITTNSGGNVFFFEGSTGGNARFITNAGGTFDMSGLSSSGMTAGSIEGAGSYLLGSKQLTVGSNDLSTDVSGVIAGVGGSLVKVGAGMLTLSGVNTYTGPTSVNGGVLDVTGSLVSAVTVNAGGILKGNGTIGGLNVVGGTVAPGNSIGTLNVAGNVAFGAGSVYQVEANAAGQADKIAATGTATIAGGTVQALPAPGPYGLSTTYTIVTSTGPLTGTFSNVTSSLAFLTPSLSYDAHDVFLTLTRNATFFSGVGQTFNQRAVGAALDSSAFGSALVQAVLPLTAAQALQAFDALSGEIHGSVQTTLLDDSLWVRQALLGRMRQASYAGAPGSIAALGAGGPALAYAEPVLSYADSTLAYYDQKRRAFPIKAPAAAPQPDLVFWAQGVGSWGRINGDGNAAEASRTLAGFISGVDRRFGEHWRAGLAAGYSNSSVSVNARASSADIDTAHLAAYAGAGFGAWNVRSGAAFSWSSVATNRSIVFPGFFDQTKARYDAATAQLFGELGYGMTLRDIAFEPFAGLALVHLDVGRFTETGGAAALVGSGNRDDVGYATLGARAAATYVLRNGMALTPRGSLAFQHAFGPVTPVAALAFQSTGAPFGVAGVPLARDSAVVDAGVDLRISPQATLGLFYLGQLAASAQNHSVNGRLSWRY